MADGIRIGTNVGEVGGMKTGQIRHLPLVERFWAGPAFRWEGADLYLGSVRMACLRVCSGGWYAVAFFGEVPVVHAVNQKSAEETAERLIAEALGFTPPPDLAPLVRELSIKNDEKDKLAREDGPETNDECKPCPFCGGKSARLYETRRWANPEFTASIRCRDCCAEVRVGTYDREAAKATAIIRWNTRTAQEPGSNAPVAGTSGGGSAEP